MKHTCRQVGTKKNENVIPACRESFLKKDAGQASMTKRGFSGEIPTYIY